jgi:nucleoside-diphosphate-sugar epimerase
MSQKTILLTGATGYLGSELLKHWLPEGHKLVVLKRSTSNVYRIQTELKECVFYNVDEPNWKKVFEENSVDVVVHTAASYGRKGETLTEVVTANTLFPIQLLNLAIKAKVPYFINTASSLPRIINDYSLSKAHFQDWLNQKKDQIHFVDMVLEYFYGPGDDDWKFISMVVKKLKENVPSIDFTSGTQKRDFIYISDGVSAYDLVLNGLEELERGISIPIGSGTAYSLRSVVELAQELMGNTVTKLNFGAIPDRLGEIPASQANTSILESLGWKLQFDLISGIKKIIN